MEMSQARISSARGGSSRRRRWATASSRSAQIPQIAATRKNLRQDHCERSHRSRPSTVERYCQRRARGLCRQARSSISRLRPVSAERCPVRRCSATSARTLFRPTSSGSRIACAPFDRPGVAVRHSFQVLAAIGGHFHATDRARAGPRQAADFVEPGAGKLCPPEGNVITDFGPIWCVSAAAFGSGLMWP